MDRSFPLTAHTTGYLNLKGRMDDGDLPMNAAEILAGVRYGQARFSGFLQGRAGLRLRRQLCRIGPHRPASLHLPRRRHRPGLAWTLQPSYGASDGDVALAAGPSLWTDEQLESLTGSGFAQENREIVLSSRMGYGIRLQFQPGDWLLIPFTELRLWQGNSHRIGLGLTLETTSWDVEFSASSEDSGNASPTGKLQLSFSKRL